MCSRAPESSSGSASIRGHRQSWREDVSNSARLLSVKGQGAYGEVERRTQGEESEKAVEDPASARAPARVWKRMAGRCCYSALGELTTSFRSSLAALLLAMGVTELLQAYVIHRDSSNAPLSAHLGEVQHGALTGR